MNPKASVIKYKKHKLRCNKTREKHIQMFNKDTMNELKK